MDHFLQVDNSLTQDAAWPVPPQLKSRDDLTPGLRIINKWTKTYLWPTKAPVPLVGPIILFPGLLTSSAKALPTRQFKFLLEAPSGVRVYENARALPQAYIVHSVIKAGTPQDAKRIVTEKGFAASSQAVVEGPFEGALSAPTAGLPETAAVKRPDVNTVTIDCKAAAPGLLVLTDTFYPGWQAQVDGRNVSIIPTNFNFRGVPIAAGNHHVVFRYQPLSFYLGVILFIAGIVIIVSFFALRRLMRRT